MARQRADTLVAVWRNADGSAAGFLPVQRTGAHTAMPVGGPVCDYHAVIGPATLDLPSAAKAMAVGRIDFTAGLKDNTVSSFLMAGDAGHVARFADGWLRRSIGPPGLFPAIKLAPQPKKAIGARLEPRGCVP